MRAIDSYVGTALAAAGWAMSYANLQVPDGFGALHGISAVAMASGYVIGRDYPSCRSPWSIVFLGSLSACCATGYYIAINHIPAGIGATILLSVLAFLFFWPFAYILAIAHNGAEGD